MLLKRRALLACVLVLPLRAAASAPASIELITADVSPRVARAPGTIRVLVRIPRNEENRRFTIGIEGNEYTSCSDLQLEGSRAPEAHLKMYEGLPAGTYAITIELWRATPRPARQLSRQVQVLALGATLDPIPTPPPPPRGRGSRERVVIDPEPPPELREPSWCSSGR